MNEYLTDLEVMHQKFHRAVTLKQQRRAAREANAKGSPHSRRSTPQPDEDEDDFGEEEDSEGEGKHDGGAKEDGRNRREGMPIEKSLNKAVAELSREYQVLIYYIYIYKQKYKKAKIQKLTNYAASGHPLTAPTHASREVPT